MGRQLTTADILRLPPTIFGTIRWSAAAGDPAGARCSGFAIAVEERTPTQFREGPAGPEPIPGTGRWIALNDAVTCFAAADQGDIHSIQFQVRGLRLNFPPDGGYRVTPALKGRWTPSPRLFFGYRAIEPYAYQVVLGPRSRTAHVEFRVVRRSAFSGRLLAP